MTFQIKFLWKHILVLTWFSTSLFAQQRNSTYGGVFTPKGELKAIVVPVYFKDASSSNPQFKNTEQWLSDWEMKDGRILPDLIDPETGLTTAWMFNRAEDFENFTDQTTFNASKLFYLQSEGQFKFIVDVFKDSTGKPVAIEIDPKGGRGWSDMNKKAFEKMKKLAPDFDWSPYDKRTNNPQYKFDNSKNPKPDGIVDYIIFTYRYSRQWAQQPAQGMSRWLGSGGGFASPAGIQLQEYNGYKFSEGFTMTWRSGVFIHELAHTLFNAPHLWGANKTVGQYFYMPSAGWGATAGIEMFRMFNAWEAWYMGYLPNLATIKEDLNQEQFYVLRDFFTQQDALRIEIPFSNGQYLWLENHAKLHPFDEHEWAAMKIGNDSIAQTPKGVYAYVEDITDRQDQIIRALSPICNGLRLLHAGGNYDYTYIDETPAKNAWGNVLYQFSRLRENPLTGTNPYFFVRADLNKDGKITLNTNFNQGKHEGMPIIREEVAPNEYKNLYQSFGVWDEENVPRDFKKGAFQKGDVLSMTTNPAIHNTPKYNEKNLTWSPIYLSGMKIKFLQQRNSDDIVVKVKYGETTVNTNLSWAGHIVLPNISRDSTEDLRIKKGKTLFLTKSGTVNRHLPQKDGSFINNTHFIVVKDAKMVLERKSRLVIEAGATLELEKGAQLELKNCAKIEVRKGGALILNGNEIIKEQKAKVKASGRVVN